MSYEDSYQQRRFVNQSAHTSTYQDEEFYTQPHYDYHQSTAERPSLVHSIHRNQHYSTNQGNKLHRVRDARTGGAKTSQPINEHVLETHAKKIVSKMIQDSALVEDSPESEQLRKDALRDMPQCLTVKRRVKRKILETIDDQNSKTSKSLTYFQVVKYKWSMMFSKFNSNLKNMVFMFELWYGALKQIEGNFGSGIASYFKFFRWLFIMNIFVTVIIVCFIIAPQLVFGIVENPTSFTFDNIFTGEGYFTKTALYYGAYLNKSVGLNANITYSMPDAYLFTILGIFAFCFITLTVSVALSYRKSFIETEGGLKNVFAHKIFCGWDFSIATKDAAELKSSSIFHDIQEIVSEMAMGKDKMSAMEWFRTRTLQFFFHVLVLLCMAGVGWLLWFLLDNVHGKTEYSVIPAIVVNVFMSIGPIFFSFIIKYEDYKNPRNVLLISLIRTFLLGAVIIVVLITFWFRQANTGACWETLLGQEIYRLILFDFIFSVILSAVIDILLFFFFSFFTERSLEFDVARHTMQIIYNQTLFWVGLFYAPLVSVMVVIKLWVTWYFRKVILLKLCKPSTKTWRAAQTQTWFLIMVFFSLVLYGGLLAYTLGQMRPSNSCGPFGKFNYTYELITSGILQLEEDNLAFEILLYIRRPGCVTLILMALCVYVYYLRAKAISQREEVNMYRIMLVWASKDKEHLLHKLYDVTNGQWQYHLQDSRENDPVNTLPEMDEPQEDGDSHPFHDIPLSHMSPTYDQYKKYY